MRAIWDDQSYWTSILSNVNVVVYNTKLVPRDSVPKRYEDLLDAKWTGKMGMEQYAYEWFANLLYVMGEENGKAFMKKLGEQKIVYRGGRTLNTELLAAGEFSLGIAPGILGIKAPPSIGSCSNPRWPTSIL